MSARSIYLRDQADKCRRHANAISDTQTQEELRKLAAEYVVRAGEIESKEKEVKQCAAGR
jgi:hypothetical protein